VQRKGLFKKRKEANLWKKEERRKEGRARGLLRNESSAVQLFSNVQYLLIYSAYKHK